MPGRDGQQPVLTPAGDSAVDQPGVPGKADLRSEAQLLGHTRPVTLDEDVRRLNQAKCQLDAFTAFEVEGDGSSSAAQLILEVGADVEPAGPLDPYHVGTEIGQHHARVWCRSEAGQLQYPQPLQWTAHDESFDNCWNKLSSTSRIAHQLIT